MLIKTYSELIRRDTFEERFEYLKLGGSVGRETFGFERYLNQAFYHSDEWKKVRAEVIARDLGCDLGLDGCDIYGCVIVHHINPITVKDIEEHNPDIFNPEYLISTAPSTHRAIHFGDLNIIPRLPTQRSKNDTCPWRQ